MRLRDPAAGDYRVEPGFGAEGYGCLSLTGPASPGEVPTQGLPPVPGLLVTGDPAEVSGLITANTTWAGPVIRVTGEVEVAATASLTIAPGVRVQFAGHHRLLVRGRLWAVGSAQQPIRFLPETGKEDKGWDGIDFLNTPAAADWSRLEHCLLQGAVADTSGVADTGPLVGGTHRPQTGGALAIVGGGRVAVASCTFRNNRADHGGAVYCGYGAAPVLAGNLFTGNTASGKGSVLFNVYAYPRLVGNTVAGNTCLAESAFERCGAVDNFNGKIKLSGDIIRDNFTNHYSGAQLFDSKAYYVSDSNIAAFSGGQGNFDLPAAFQGWGSHPYRLTGSSPGRDVGPANLWNALLADTDVAGAPRVAFGARDLGAYEYNGVVAAVDAPLPRAGVTGLSCAPNPFNPRTRIAFRLERSGTVQVTVHDLRGRLVRRLAGGFLPAGNHALAWDGCDERGQALPSGIYTCRVRTADGQAALKMTLVR